MLGFRASGALLHITSLPSSFGIGDFGPEAYRFADVLARSGQVFWQVLPLGPSAPVMGNSPYAGFSAFAGNPLLVSPELLVRDGWLPEQDLPSYYDPSPEELIYSYVIPYKKDVLTAAFRAGRDKLETHAPFLDFCERAAHWLDDWALFATLSERFGGLPWYDWPDALRDRDPAALAEAGEELTEQLLREKFVQYLITDQWMRLRAGCHARGVTLVGDLPFYVADNSADVWAHRSLFRLDGRGLPTHVAGVPPDYFSDTGQRWGNPVFDWNAHRREGFSWWLRRLRHNVDIFDILRLDHFRGFAGYWEIPASEPTAVKGKWVDSPGEELFLAYLHRHRFLPVIAEDLGVITPDVRELMHRFGFPGMKVLQFAFGDESSKHIPYFFERDCVVYTGTHDNNPVREWYVGEATEAERAFFHRYIGRIPSPDEVHWEFVRLAQNSVAQTVIVPVQDVFGLGGRSRMNRPATTQNNWAWRLHPEYGRHPAWDQLKEITVTAGRGF